MELKEYLDAKVEAVSNDPMIPETIFGCQMTPCANYRYFWLKFNCMTTTFNDSIKIIMYSNLLLGVDRVPKTQIG